MFIHKVGDYWKLSESRWVDGRSRRVLIAHLGKQEGKAKQKLEKLAKLQVISSADCKRLSERFNSDIWGTPLWVIEMARQVMGSVDLDPCTQPQNPTGATKFFTEEDDGLAQEWSGNVWMNPPYSDPLPWMKKLVESVQSGSVKSAIALIKTGQLQNVGTGALIHGSGGVMLLWRGRLKFVPLREGRTSKPPNFDVTAVYWGNSPDRFREVFSSHCFL